MRKTFPTRTTPYGVLTGYESFEQVYPHLGALLNDAIKKGFTEIRRYSEDWYPYLNDSASQTYQDSVANKSIVETRKAAIERREKIKLAEKYDFDLQMANDKQEHMIISGLQVLQEMYGENIPTSELDDLASQVDIEGVPIGYVFIPEET